MAQAILHIKFITPKHHTPLLSLKSFPKCHVSYSYPTVQAMKNSSSTLIMEDKSSITTPYWAFINGEIEAHLNRAIPIREPLEVFEPMYHLTFDGPRSMGPALCVAACELVGGNRAQALPAASALHVMHAAVQAHDYLPLTDRPRPKTRSNTINHVYPSGIELQIGDGLLSFGYELLAGLEDPNRPENSGRVLRVIVEVARAMGGQGMVEGQYRELLENGEKCEEMWIKHSMYEKKSGGLYSCGAACGAILGEASEEEIEKLRNYGIYVGIIQGMSHVHRNNKNNEINEAIQNLRELAFKELDFFNNPLKTQQISSFLGVEPFGNA